jgi:hypothetical protein
MADVVTLLVPLEEAYRALGPEMAKKYLELSGGSAKDADALAAALNAALAEVAGGAPPNADVAIEFEHEAGGIDVHVKCGGRTTVVSQPLPARKS